MVAGTEIAGVDVFDGSLAGTTGAVVVVVGPIGSTRRGVVVGEGTDVVDEDVLEVVVDAAVVEVVAVVVEVVAVVVVVVAVVVVVVVAAVVVVAGGATCNEALALSTLGLSHGVPPPLALHAHTVYEPAATNGTGKEPLMPPPESTVHPPTWLESSVGIAPVLKWRSQERPGV